MKRTILTIAFAAIASMAAAQTYTFRQDLKQEINHLVVKGSSIVRLEHDTCNWVAYKGEKRNDTARLVVIEGNRLTTTAAADNRTLYVGTTAGKDSAEYLLTFDIEDNGVVVYNGKANTKGHITYDCYNPKKDNTKRVSGIRKYGPDDRVFFDYYLGTAFWHSTGMTTAMNTTINPNPVYPDEMSILTNTGVKIGYSLYMDDHIAAGFGIQYGFYSPQFKSPLVSYSASDNSLSTATSDSAGIWNTSAYMHTVGIPLHFTYFPIPTRHRFNVQLELIPQFSFGHKLEQHYQHETANLTINNTYTKDLPYSLLNLTARFSINYGTLGFYAEYGINPISRNLKYDNNTISPHYACLGVRINLFELGKK
ncbi:MAG: hypothetical protein IKG81_11360 [Bacteroidales bacterium]|nr:hypothetical protein [Bacteroidales bacterium]